jgi:hypothetical protein
MTSTPEPDRLVNVLIARAVRGEPSPWPTDDFRWKGSFQATFKAGDKQILLWAIEDCARRGAQIPKWAAKALHDIMFRGVARGKFESWEDAFGPISADQQRTIRPRQHMAGVWTRIRKRHSEGCKDWEELYEDASKHFGIGIGKVKEYYGAMQKFMEEHAPETESERESVSD